MRSREPSKQEIAQFLFARQPGVIRQRLSKIAKIEQAVGLSSRFVVNIPTLGSADASELFKAAQAIFQDKTPNTLTCFDGTKLRLELAGDVVTAQKELEDRQGQASVSLRELTVLSLDSEARQARLLEIMDRIGVAAPFQSSVLISAIRSAPLAEDHLVALFRELSDGVQAVHRRAVESMNRGRPKLDDLVPSGRHYYELFGGPIPQDVTPDQYLGDLLPAYRQGLLKRDLAQGLDICVAGGLSPELSPSRWTTDIPNDVLWGAIDGNDPWRDPYSLLNCLEMALGRIKDPRFNDFAKGAAAKLTAAAFVCGKDQDGLELLPLFSALVLDRMNDVEALNLCPPYWKRMCAWMHGSTLLRITQDYPLNLEELRKWTASCRSVEAVFTRLRDLRPEPMFRSTEMSKRTLAAEIIGRLALLVQKDDGSAMAIGLPDLVESAQKRIAEEDPVGWFTPGPLEGHRSPREKGRKFTADDISAAYTVIEKSTVQHLWFGMARMSQLCDLTDAVIRKAADRTAFLVNQSEDFDEAMLNGLGYAAVVAGAHRDTHLGDLVASSVCSLLRRGGNEDDISTGIQTLLMAAAANSSEDAWSEWLEAQLSNLSKVKFVVPLEKSIVDRAEAISSLAS
jgi:hypothetical protein